MRKKSIQMRSASQSKFAEIFYRKKKEQEEECWSRAILFFGFVADSKLDDWRYAYEEKCLPTWEENPVSVGELWDGADYVHYVYTKLYVADAGEPLEDDLNIKKSQRWKEQISHFCSVMAIDYVEPGWILAADIKSR
jgi:hypothetical protein